MVTQGNHRVTEMTQQQREQQLFRLKTFTAKIKRERASKDLRAWYAQYKAAPFDTPLR